MSNWKTRDRKYGLKNKADVKCPEVFLSLKQVVFSCEFVVFSETIRLLAYVAAVQRAPPFSFSLPFAAEGCVASSCQSRVCSRQARA